MSPAAPAPAPGGLRQIAANGAALLLAYVLPRLFTVASLVVAARYLGPERFGLYGAAAAFAVVLSIVATLGMQPLLIREMARNPHRARRLLRAAHVVKTGTNVVMLATLMLVARWALEDSLARQAALVLGLGYALAAYAENLAAWFQAVERMRHWTHAAALFGFVSGSVGVALLLWTGSLVAFCWGPAVGWAAALAWLRVRLPPELRGAGAVSLDDVLLLLRGLAPFAAAFVGLTIYCKVDILLLARLREQAEVGLYAAAYKFVDVFQALVIVAAGAVYPRLSRAAEGGTGPGPTGVRSTEIILLGAVPVALMLHLLAGPVVTLVFGPDYAPAAAAVRTLAVLLPLLALSIHGGYVLGALGRMAPVAVAYAVGVALNVTLNLALIPTHGALGSALARLGSEVVVAGALVTTLAVAAHAAPRVRTVATAGGLAAAGALLWLVPDPTGGWLRAAAGLAVGIAVYAGAGVLTREERSALRELLAGASPSRGRRV